MTNTKSLYKSDAVILTRGEDAQERAAEASGKSVEYIDTVTRFAQDIISNAVDKHLSTEQCYTACLNALCLIIDIAAHTPEAKSQIVGATTEALCAFVGGGSDQGVTQ